MDNKQDVLSLLREVADGSVTPEQAMLELKRSPLRTWATPGWTPTAPCAREPRR